MKLFELLRRYEKTLNKNVSERNYWEKTELKFNDNCIGPDGEYYSEKELYNFIKESDKQRLIKFSK